jgi:acetyl esterase/lipase
MKRLIALMAGIGAACIGVGLVRQHRRVVTVAPELRSPRLYVPVSLRNDTILRLGRKAMTVPVPVAAGVEVHTEHVPATDRGPAVRTLVYERPGRQQPSGALLWIHGGGLVMGTPEVGNGVCSRFAAELGIVVVSVDYRLAPEHPFPAALDDCFAAITWMRDRADALGIDPSRIVVGGDSAGGGLAACLVQMAHDRGGPDICFQLLQYPMLDDRTALRADHDALVWSNTSNRYAWGAYLGHPVSQLEARPYASAARRDDLGGLPPAWIGVGSIDLFHDECITYVDRLRAAGVTCELHVVPGMYHAAEIFSPAVPSMVELLDRMTAALGAATSS